MDLISHLFKIELNPLGYKPFQLMGIIFKKLFMLLILQEKVLKNLSELYEKQLKEKD